jgi:uncharacterized protein YidB (DUF937 family)
LELEPGVRTELNRAGRRRGPVLQENDMGLLDSVLGGLTGSNSGSSSGTSPLVKALLVLLAAKAASSHFGKSDAPPVPAPDASGKITSGILAGMPSLDTLLGHFRGSPHENKVQSWIGTGPNKPIAPDELEHALGPDTLAKLQQESGLPRDQLLAQLAGALPQVVDKLTPHGRAPTVDETKHW